MRIPTTVSMPSIGTIVAPRNMSSARRAWSSTGLSASSSITSVGRRNQLHLNPQTDGVTGPTFEYRDFISCRYDYRRGETPEPLATTPAGAHPSRLGLGRWSKRLSR